MKSLLKENAGFTSQQATEVYELFKGARSFAATTPDYMENYNTVLDTASPTEHNIPLNSGTLKESEGALTLYDALQELRFPDAEVKKTYQTTSDKETKDIQGVEDYKQPENVKVESKNIQNTIGNTSNYFNKLMETFK